MWLSNCCSEEPNFLYSMSGDPYIGFIGVCSECKEYAGFKEYEEDYDE